MLCQGGDLGESLNVYAVCTMCFFGALPISIGITDLQKARENAINADDGPRNVIEQYTIAV